MKPKYSFILVSSLIFSLLLVPTLYLFKISQAKDLSIERKRDTYISQKDDIIRELIVKGDYACCLTKPCAYCIEKTPGHGEGATCHCLEDVVEGRHPCGECIGEILEGHGNKFLAPYFSRAIAEEVGEKYAGTLKEIISEKYGISLEKQL